MAKAKPEEMSEFPFYASLTSVICHLYNVLPEGFFTQRPGRTELVEHQVVLKDDHPVRQPAYSIPEGVNEPSFSEWSHPIFLVPKKDGGLRFCLDFRKVPLAEGSTELTPFRTPFGHFQFTVLPFGLHRAPASFQWLMESPQQGFAVAYLDEIIIYSVTWEEHLHYLQQVLSLVKEVGLTIHPDKCALARSGNILPWLCPGRGVIHPQVGKVEGIMAAERPTTKKQVWSFLGLVGWYRRFIPNFSEKASGLSELTRKCQTNKVEWTE
ncbi:hypothetical protein ACEWY4_027315 [Coilia grayii]|uniref:ribonuclease H n=1 Tax=Coilia grayii TaxID=363190 RepID=A0ABD1IV42_9TELE